MMTRDHRFVCERDALQPDPKIIRAKLRAGGDQSGRLPDRSDAVRAIVDSGWKIGGRTERTGAHISAVCRRSALRRHLLFALAHRTTRATRSSRKRWRPQ